MISNDSLYQKLLELEFVPKSELDKLLEEANKTSRYLSDVLFDRDILTSQQIGQTIADFYNLPYVEPTQLAILPEISNLLPQIFSQKQSIIAFKKDNQGLHLATSDPENSQSLDFVAKKTGLPQKIYYTTPQNIQKYFDSQQAGLGENFEKTISDLVAKITPNQNFDQPVISIVDQIMSYAEKNHTSDIHLEPQETKAVVRYRIDGILHDVLTLPLEIYPQLITRIKVISRLRIDEHQAAQDGKFQFENDNSKIDVRVSITPITNGEKVVMRLLSVKSRQFSLSTLGFSDEDLKKVESAIKKPFGMILVTGPTGSGKTTTLYAVLKLLNSRLVNIMTIEDPVEYEVEGVNQIQVNPATNLNFSEGLRSIVRQDPDIILVGEIRDQETASIASQAALTGHLVLSTLHTNDALTTIPRLLEMGIEPFIIASSVNVIIAQRLVRQICSKCRTSKEVSASEVESLSGKKIKEKIRIYYGKGCEICHNTGYSGRIGIFEVLLVEGAVKEKISDGASIDEMTKLVNSNKFSTMLSDGWQKVLTGQTSMEEVIRVTKS